MRCIKANLQTNILTEDHSESKVHISFSVYVIPCEFFKTPTWNQAVDWYDSWEQKKEQDVAWPASQALTV